MDEYDEPIRLNDQALRTWQGGLAAEQLIEECEAFLDGRYVEILTRRGRRVPVWAWTNLLAHGSERALHRALAAHPGRAEAVWWTARAYAAGQVLGEESRGGSLSALQAAVLIPLELQLAARPDTEAWLPSDWVSAVLTALADGSNPVTP